MYIIHSQALKEENEGRIVFCNNGSFYVAIGNDAILLNIQDY